MNTPTITMHKRDENGWQEVKTHYADSTKWDDIDRGWISELFSSASNVLTVGNIMYELNPTYRPTEEHKAMMSKALADDYTISQQRGWSTE